MCCTVCVLIVCLHIHLLPSSVQVVFLVMQFQGCTCSHRKNILLSASLGAFKFLDSLGDCRIRIQKDHAEVQEMELQPCPEGI